VLTNVPVEDVGARLRRTRRSVRRRHRRDG
jgi:hypothetical protein